MIKIVFELQSIADKKIWNKLYKLKDYNEPKERRKDKDSISIYLPKKLHQQDKTLIPEYVKQLKVGQKVQIQVCYDTAQMVLVDKPPP